MDTIQEWDYCPGCGEKKANMYSHLHHFPDHKPNHWVGCPSCSVRYKDLGKHWYRSDCPYPSPTNEQIDILTGVLMGDGSINIQRGNNPRIQVSSFTTPEYLYYLDSLFPILGNGVEEHLSAEEVASNIVESGLRNNANPDNYSDTYLWRTRNNPHLEEFYAWYDTGKKVFPEELHLTPATLRHWFCCDGSWENTGTSNRIKIGINNEISNQDKIQRYFRNGPGVEVSTFTRDEYEDHVKCEAVFTVSSSQELWEYMGSPPPGFEYKWPEKYHEEGDTPHPDVLYNTK